MKKLFSILVLVLIIGALISFGGIKVFSGFSQTVRAFGDLTVDFHVPADTPLFNVNNVAPGDPPTTKNVDVTNGGTLPRYVVVKGVRAGGIGNEPKLESVLDLTVKDGTTIIYQEKLANFFAGSTTQDQVKLGIINPLEHKTYSFIISLPSDAGNDFQAKSVVFDLSFGYITSNNLVINEVYYKVDQNHGLDSVKDRGNTVNLEISGNGRGSKNTIKVNIKDVCKIIQSNKGTVTNIVSSSATTGSNKVTASLGNTSVISGIASSVVNIVNTGSLNQASCGEKLGQNNEWVELFNPTDHNISLKNWRLIDNSGKTTVIHANKTIKAGGFALLSKDSSTWKYWDTKGVLKINLGKQIGDGLDNTGDHLILKNSKGNEIDRTSWGTDTLGFTPPNTNPAVLQGSTERLVPGFDTDKASDWKTQNPPDPGN